VVGQIRIKIYLDRQVFRDYIGKTILRKGVEMKVRHLISTFLVLTAFSYSVKGQQILNSFPSPGNGSRGLAWDGEYLWCADASTDSVYKLNPSSGAVISSFPFSIASGYGGLTWGKDSTIWIANGYWMSQVNPSTGNTISQFHCPGG